MKKFVLSLIGILFLVFLFLFWGGAVFTKLSLENSVSSLKDSIDFSKKEVFNYSEIEDLPLLLQNYFKGTIKDSTLKPQFITVKQTADFKTELKSDWLPLSATQYFTTNEPNFLWFSEMKTSSFFWVNAIDSY